MGLFDKLKKFFFGPVSRKRRKRRKSASKKRAAKRSAVRPKKKKAPKALAKKSVRKPAVKSARKAKPLPSEKKAPPAPKKKTVAKKANKKTASGRSAAGVKVAKAKKSVPAPEVKDPGVYLGAISHYFAKVRAAVIPLEEILRVGDKIWIGQPGAAGFRQSVKSLQINRIPIEEGRPGEEVGLEVTGDVHVGDKVYRLNAGR